MSISTSEAPGQLAESVYKQLLNLLKRDVSPQAASRKQQWRFVPPQRSSKTEAALRAYWGEVFKDELAALESEWAAPRESTPITTDTLTLEVQDVSINKAS